MASPPTGMPWLTILITLLTFFMSGGAEKKNRGKAIAAAALAGVGTYYVTHETDWGQQTLGSLDGVAVPGAGVSPVVDANGNEVLVSGAPVKPPVASTSTGETVGKGLWDVLKSWGPAGTAAVVGVGGSAITGKTNWPLIAGLGLLVVLVLK